MTKIPLVIAYGLGVDSTAVLVELARQARRPDLILFADTGNEKQETYDYLPYIQDWLAKVGFPPVQVVTNVVTDFKHWPPYKGLGENCLTNGTLPSLAFGFKSCSLKWKVTPQNKFTSTWQPACDCWAAGLKVRKIIGYDAGAKDMKRYAQAIGVEDPLYDYEYSLVEWGWDRARCIAEITKAGLRVPMKSACYFCPATHPEELHQHKKIYLRYIVIMEARAVPRLDGHIPQEEHDRRYTIAMGKWANEYKRIERLRAVYTNAGKKIPKKLKLPKKPKRGCTKTGCRGLWRKPVKGTRGGTPHTGMMTDYIREQGLLPAEEIDYLIANAPLEIIDNQQKFATGLEIPEWHDFIEAFTPEDALDEVGMPKLQLLESACGSGCEGCVCH